MNLSRSLGAMFRPAPARKPDPHRKARAEAKRLAAEHGVELETIAGAGVNVWPPKGYRLADPFDGDHYAQHWAEALDMVRAYAGLVPNEAAALDAPPAEPAPALTPAERQARRRQRVKAAGLVELRAMFAHPDDLPEIRAFVAKVARRRERAARVK